METKNIINIPEGYEIDKEQSNNRQIVLRKIEDEKVRSWEEYCEKMKGKDSYFFNGVIQEICRSNFGEFPNLLEFEDKEDVEALVAFCKLRKMRKQWIGEWEPDWTNKNQMKFSIARVNKGIGVGENQTISRSMSFPTKEMRNEFFETFKDLLEIAKPLL